MSDSDHEHHPELAGEPSESAVSPDAAPAHRSWREGAQSLVGAAREQYTRRGAPYLRRAWDALARLRPPSPESVSGQSALLWRWSPLLAPLALAGILLLVAFTLVGHHVGRAPAITRHEVKTLAVVLLVLGLALAVALYLARDVATWAFALLFGVGAALIATVFVLLGRNAAIAAAVLLLMAGATFLRRQRVAENTIAITTFLGGFHRTLLPGQRVLLPGEQVRATLPTEQRRLTALPPPPTAGAEAQATATLVYQLIPREAHRAALMGADWESALQQLLARSLREELQRWPATLAGSDPSGAAVVDAHADTTETETEDEDEDEDEDELRLRTTLEARLRQEAHRWGLRVLAVELSQVALRPQAPRAQAANAPTAQLPAPDAPVLADWPAVWPPQRPVQRQAAPEEAVPRAETQPLAAAPGSDDPTVALDGPGPTASASSPAGSGAPRLLSRLSGLAAALQMDSRRGPQPGDDHEMQGLRPDSAETDGASASSGEENTGAPADPGTPSSPASISPEVLTAAYEAVREQRIGDPGTIRQIADRFAALAAASGPESDLAFDPEAAARILRQRAEELALAMGEEPEAPAAPAEQPPPTAPYRPPPPRAERDENLTSGG